MVQALHERGYLTGMVGKYLNSWDGADRHEFSLWASPRWPKYRDPRLNLNGEWVEIAGTNPGIPADLATRFLALAADDERPFFLMLSSRAPHKPATVHEGYRNLFGSATIPDRPPVESDLSDKPRWIRKRSSPVDRAGQTGYYRDQIRTLRALDDGINLVLGELDRLGLRNDTVVFFISDNGWLHGQHGLTGKGVPYEPAVRVPFAVRYPDGIESSRTEDRLVANIDIAPTIYDLAGVEAPYPTDGRSLTPLFGESEATWRDTLLLEGWTETAVTWAAAHDGDHVLIRTKGQQAELYDLAADPHQLESVVEDPGYAEVRDRLESELARWRPEMVPGS